MRLLLIILVYILSTESEATLSVPGPVSLQIIYGLEIHYRINVSIWEFGADSLPLDMMPKSLMGENRRLSKPLPSQSSRTSGPTGLMVANVPFSSSATALAVSLLHRSASPFCIILRDN